MNFHLVVTNTQQLIESDQAFPALQKLLAVGHHVIIDEALDHFFCAQMDVPAQLSDGKLSYPIATLSWLGDSKEQLQEIERNNIFRADPVHLILQRDSFILAEPVPLPLSQNESSALIQTLNQHFSPDGFTFKMGQSGRWYMQSDKAFNINTSLPELAINQNIQAFLPQGEDLKRCSQLLNELQMLMFGHPVNASRENARILPMNSVWLSGEGDFSNNWQTSHKAIYSNHPLAQGIAKAAGLSLHNEAVHFDELFNSKEPEVWALINNEMNLEANFFMPALTGLKSKKVLKLNLHFELGRTIHSVEIKPIDLWKFWRPLKAINQYFKI